MMSKHEAARVQLRSELARLVKRVGAIEGDLRAGHDRDSEEQAIELENDEVLAGLDEIAIGEVARIRAALKRIEEGTYGMCVTCGRAIGDERLAAMPSAVQCVNCSARQGGHA